MIKMLGLGLHFLLELCALAGLTYWGFRTGEAVWQKLLLGVGVPLLAAAVWGVFRVPNDPGAAPVPVSGPLRLALEWLVLGGAAAGLLAAGQRGLGLAFAVAILVDYSIMFERVLWLVRGR